MLESKKTPNKTPKKKEVEEAEVTALVKEVEEAVKEATKQANAAKNQAENAKKQYQKRQLWIARDDVKQAEEKAKKAEEYLKTRGIITRLDNPFFGLHTSMYYFCCHAKEEKKTITSALHDMKWEPFDISYDSFACNLDRQLHCLLACTAQRPVEAI